MMSGVTLAGLAEAMALGKCGMHLIRGETIGRIPKAKKKEEFGVRRT